MYMMGELKRDHLEASHLCVSNIWEAFWRLISPYSGWHCLGVREYVQRMNTITSLRTYTFQYFQSSVLSYCRKSRIQVQPIEKICGSQCPWSH